MKAIPYVEGGKLYRPDGSVICAVGPKTGWLDWLNRPETKSFRFRGLAGTHCTVIRETRKGRSGNQHPYWYTHRHVLGRLRRVYLGRSENLTLQALEAAAAKLAQLEMGAPDGAKNGA